MNVQAQRVDASRGLHSSIPRGRQLDSNGAKNIRDNPIAPGSPWQNGFAERLTGLRFRGARSAWECTVLIARHTSSYVVNGSDRHSIDH